MVTVGSIKLNQGRKVLLNRYAKSTPDYSIPTYGSVGINGTTPNRTDTALVLEIPITYQQSNALTAVMIGYDSGSNSTQNTAIYKPGGGLTDNTAQNLLKSSTALSDGIWTTTVSNVTTSNYAGLWLYLSSTALGYLGTTTAVEIRIGSNTSTDYYYHTKPNTYFSSGWNWITTANTINSWSTAGTPSGAINQLGIKIWTTTSTATFTASDAVTDLLMTYTASDTYKALDSITLDETALQNTYTLRIVTTEAVGFPITQAGIKNADSASKLLLDKSTFDEESKGDTDVIIVSWIDRIL